MPVASVYHRQLSIQSGEVLPAQEPKAPSCSQLRPSSPRLVARLVSTDRSPCTLLWRSTCRRRALPPLSLPQPCSPSGGPPTCRVRSEEGLVGRARRCLHLLACSPPPPAHRPPTARRPTAPRMPDPLHCRRGGARGAGAHTRRAVSGAALLVVATRRASWASAVAPIPTRTWCAPQRPAASHIASPPLPPQCPTLQLVCDMRANTPKDGAFLRRHSHALAPRTAPGWLVRAPPPARPALARMLAC